MGETCGVVTGAFMVLGLKHGRTTVKDTQAHEKTNSLINEFTARFKSRNKSILCKELIDRDISTPEGLTRAREKNLFTTMCPKYIQDAAEIIEDLLKLQAISYRSIAMTTAVRTSSLHYLSHVIH